jgi:hypothetical protein
VTAAVAVAIAILLLPATGYAEAEGGSTSSGGFADSAANVAAIGFDAVILRPIGFAVVLVGGVLFVPAALITAPNGWDSIVEAKEIFIDAPVERTFQRPLGDF